MQNISDSRTAVDRPPARFQLHGVLVQVRGVGVLLLGESGTGKSDCALELILDGHQLVADDVVEVWEVGHGIAGAAPALTRGLLAIRGLGILKVREVFGEPSVQSDSRIDLCVELRERSGHDVDRVTACEESIAGYRIPKFVVDRRSTRKPATFIKTAVQLRQVSEQYGAQELFMAEQKGFVGAKG